MTPEEAHTAEGFGIAGTIAFWTSAAGFVIFSVALFHFLSWWGVVGGAGVALIAFASLLRTQLDRAQALMASRRTDEMVADHLTRIESGLAGIRDRLDQIEYNALSPPEKERRSFESAAALTLSRVKSFKEGHQVQLMLLSPVAVERFEYEHRLLDSLSGNSWHDVFGFRQEVGSEGWSDFQFLVSDTTARSKDGFVIKEAISRQPHNIALHPTAASSNPPSGRG